MFLVMEMIKFVHADCDDLIPSNEDSVQVMKSGEITVHQMHYMNILNQKFCACNEFKISYFYINLSQPSFGQMNQQMQKNVKNSLITEVIVQIK
ncbi:hypothetical protein T06_7971 [Trichinella sp. T6]|nr:hypothetical protein T06_7971 [Trichinella sp. T6]